MTVTLEAIKEKQSEIAKLIAAFEQQPPLPTFPMEVPAPDLKTGERHVATLISADGSRRYHLILLPGQAIPMDWKAANEWADGIGGALPDRVESALLFALMKDEFVEEAYWTGEQHAAYSDCAWYQSFSNGSQGSYGLTSKLRARAVRRLVIQ
jgi:hypothetical protein